MKPMQIDFVYLNDDKCSAFIIHHFSFCIVCVIGSNIRPFNITHIDDDDGSLLVFDLDFENIFL